MDVYSPTTAFNLLTIPRCTPLATVQVPISQCVCLCAVCFSVEVLSGYGSLPATAAVAEREGRYVAQHMSSASHTAPFSFKSLGMMAYLGGFSALAEVKPIKGRFKGFVAWILWRSAYLTMLGNWRSRFQVPLDWFKTFCFGRDTSRFESDLWSADSARPKKTRT